LRKPDSGHYEVHELDLWCVEKHLDTDFADIGPIKDGMYGILGDLLLVINKWYVKLSSISYSNHYCSYGCI